MQIKGLIKICFLLCSVNWIAIGQSTINPVSFKATEIRAVEVKRLYLTLYSKKNQHLMAPESISSFIDYSVFINISHIKDPGKQLAGTFGSDDVVVFTVTKKSGSSSDESKVMMSLKAYDFTFSHDNVQKDPEKCVKNTIDSLIQRMLKTKQSMRFISKTPVFSTVYNFDKRKDSASIATWMFPSVAGVAPYVIEQIDTSYGKISLTILEMKKPLVYIDKFRDVPSKLNAITPRYPNLYDDKLDLDDSIATFSYRENGYTPLEKRSASVYVNSAKLRIQDNVYVPERFPHEFIVVGDTTLKEIIERRNLRRRNAVIYENGVQLKFLFDTVYVSQTFRKEVIVVGDSTLLNALGNGNGKLRNMILMVLTPLFLIILNAI